MRHSLLVALQTSFWHFFRFLKLVVWRPVMTRRMLATGLLTVMVWWAIPPAIASARTTAPPASSIQPYIDRVLDRITEFTLDNGMRFIVMERHQAPVISFMTYVDVGAAYEAEGKTGAAHFLEHLAFKGTTRIGTSDYEAETALLDRLDGLFDQIQAAKVAGQQEEVAKLQEEFDTIRAEASRYVKQNEMGQIVEQAGGVGLNATTSADATRYFYSFPANKLELWMSLESERFLEPVFREFYEEKEVILEERRMRTDNSPIGKMIEQFLETAFPGHPYGRPIIGYESDIRNLRRSDIRDFFETYYTPSHMIAAVVGDVDPDQVKRLARRYFGRYHARSEAPEVEAVAPTQTEPREVTLRLPTQPWYLEGYQRPSIQDPDNLVYQIIAALFTSGRTSRMYKSLVEEQQLALSIQASNGFPGDRYPTMMLIYALTAPGHTVEEVAAAMDTEIQRLKTEPVSPQELDRIKTQARAGLLELLASNQGMASLLPEYEANTGDWRNLFEDLRKFEAITAEDVQRVAQTTFVPEKLTIGKLLPTE
ncbi:MAG: pitrilysin family protein [Oculatellaceae cyanobacterium bins.114]|nr:pitrilysin family protein [Oculatellaceae cyanobacterium bins.114]